MKKTCIALCALIAPTLMVSSTDALEDSTSMQMEVNITGVSTTTCGIGTIPAINFGDMTPTSPNLDTTQEIKVTCGVGTAYQISMDGGLNSVNSQAGDASTYRNLALGASSVKYRITVPGGGSLDQWGDAGYAGTYNFPTVGGFGSGVIQTYVAGIRLLPDGTTITANGIHTDTVQVTVHF